MVSSAGTGSTVTSAISDYFWVFNGGITVADQGQLFSQMLQLASALQSASLRR